MQLRAPLLTDAAIERLVQRAVAALGLWATGGEEGLGRAPSERIRARMATLVWAERSDAEGWAHLAAVPGRPKFLSLSDLFVDVLPRLASRDLLFDVDLLAAARDGGWRVVEVPTVWIDQEGSRVSTVADSRRMGASLLRLWLRRQMRRRRRQGRRSRVHA